MGELELELLRRGYRAMGLGTPADVLRLFDQDASPAPVWIVVDTVGGDRSAAREVVADDLFGAVPPQWEVTSVQPTVLRQHEAADGSLTVVAQGTYRCRPRGSWGAWQLPFAHVWSLRDGHVRRVVCYLEGVELRRLSP